MAKKVIATVKLQISGGSAKPEPPIAPALGPHGVNMMEFCKEFNARTQSDAGLLIPVEITIYADRSFSFVTKKPPVSFLLKKTLNIEKGSPEPNRQKVGTITIDQIREIAEVKIPDLNATSIDAAMKIVIGTAKNMGITVEGE